LWEPIGGNTGAFSNVLSVLTYGATTITAVRLRLWTRLTGAGTAWVPGMSSDDGGAPFTPSTDPMKTALGEQRVFAVGAGVRVPVHTRIDESGRRCEYGCLRLLRSFLMTMLGLAPTLTQAGAADFALANPVVLVCPV